MKTVRTLFLLLLSTVLVCSCKKQQSNAGCDIPSTIPYDATIPNPAFPLPGVTVPYAFLEDLCYGSDPLQRFDIFIPESNVPVPVVIFIHGGGFEAEDKKAAYDTNAEKAKIGALLNEKIAFASINYRLLAPTGETLGIRDKCFADAVRCLQFIRFNAASLNIDPDAVALKGGSAGAGTSLWIAFSDDMKTSGATDLTGESTRVTAVVAQETQATYDLAKWPSVVFGGAFTLADIATTLGEDRIRRIYGDPSLTAGSFLTATQTYRYDVDILRLMDLTDPPFWIESDNSAALPAIGDAAALNHHPYHAAALIAKAQSFSPDMEHYSDVPNITGGVNKWPYSDEIDFLVDKLK